MRFEFINKDLRSLYTDEKNAHRYPPGLVDSFFDVIAIITNAANENDIRALTSLHYEKLKGKREGQVSLRLNDQFRLIIQIIDETTGKKIQIIEIVDYH